MPRGLKSYVAGFGEEFHMKLMQQTQHHAFMLMMSDLLLWPEGKCQPLADLGYDQGKRRVGNLHTIQARDLLTLLQNLHVERGSRRWRSCLLSSVWLTVWVPNLSKLMSALSSCYGA